MASSEIKVSGMTFLSDVPDDAKIYVVKPGETTPYYTTKAALLADISGGTTPSLPQVLAQGDRPIRYSDGDGDTILELADREKFLYNSDADFLHLPAELFPDGTELKIHNAGEIDLFGITGSEYSTIIQINGIDVDEFTPITLRAGTAILKKISGEPYSAEIWTLTYEVYDFSNVFNWGNISGDISTQTDLIALLNTKQNNPLYLSQVDDFALLNTTAFQRIFSGGVDNDGAIPIVAGTRYLIRADINFIELSASVSKSLSIGFLGTSAASEVSIFIWGIITNETGLATVQMARMANYGGVFSASSSLASFGRIHMSGILECSTSGKLIPSVQFNVSGVGGKTKKGSTFLAIPLGPITSSHN